MTLFDRLLLVLGVLCSYAAHLDAKEAHRHTHELACYVGAEELCQFHEVKP